MTRGGPHAPRGPGFTLVEVLLALVVTTLVGLATVAMLSATAYGTTSRQHARTLLITTRVVDARLGAALRSAQEVVYPNSGQPTATDYLVLWVNDENGDDVKQHGEMQLIERDSATNELRSYRNSADATTYADVAGFRAAALASYPGETWAHGVSALDLAATTTPAGTVLVSFRLTVSEGGESESAVGAVAPRQ